MKKNTIYLKNIDGFEFEKVCKNIFSNLNYGEIEQTPLVGDKGKDLIIHTTQGNILVECKHQPKSAIGRPIIQKIHSAVISENAIKGIVITTGTFSKDAIEHAKTLKPQVELVDEGILIDLAVKAGYELVTSSGKGTIYTYPIGNNQLIENNVSKYLEKILESKPNKIRNLIKIKNRKIQLRPEYYIKYLINAKFFTSVGCIHSVQDEGFFFIDGITGGINDYLSNYFFHVSANKLEREVIKTTRTHPFKVLSGYAKEIATKFVIEKYTIKKSYIGGNNQNYTKLCKPKKKDIIILDISQVYLPENNLDFYLNRKHRNLNMVDNGTSNFYVINQNFLVCEICGIALNERGILCNDCGNISHDMYSSYKSHGFYCKDCGKSICRNCTSYYRKYLIFKNNVCNVCAEKKIRSGKNVKRYKPFF